MERVTIHATTVAFLRPGGANALVIRGASGSGKSGLALELLAMGAWLVSDDQTQLHRDGDALLASAPGPIRDLIEWRGIGLLPAQSLGAVPVVALADLDKGTTARMPEPEYQSILGLRLPCLHIRGNPAASAGLRQYMVSCAWQHWGQTAT